MQQQTPLKVLLIGDSCIDKYVYGEVKRLNPEAPVPVLDYKREETRKGMAWNVYNNLSAFGVNVTIMTNKETITKTRYIDERYNQQILRVDDEVLCLPMKDSIPNKHFDAIVISDYNKGFITEEKLFDIVANAKCPVFVDSKKSNLPKNNCFVKINDIEYEKLEEGYKNVIITRGSSGAEYQGILYPGEKVNVYDVVGAGDTFLAALTYGYIKYGKMNAAIQFANKAAAIAVSNPGTYVLNEKDVECLCD